MSRRATPLVTVIIVNFNAGDRLQRCLQSLQHQTFSDFETILVDNGSTDNSLRHAHAAALPVAIDEVGENLGFAAANNRASKKARGKWLALLNPDAYPDPNWLEMLVAATQRYPDVDAFGSTQVDAAHTDKLDGAGDCWHAFGIPYRGHHGWPIQKLPAEGECFAPCAAAAMIRRATFERLCGFEESFFCYCEDVDLAYRLRLSGGKAMQIPTARVLHEGSGLTGARSEFTIYHGHRNRLWTYYRNTPLILLALSAPFQLLMSLYLLGRFAVLGQAGPYWRALRDGIGGWRAFAAHRRAVLSQKAISSFTLAKSYTWSPLALYTKKATSRRHKMNP